MLADKSYYTKKEVQSKVRQLVKTTFQLVGFPHYLGPMFTKHGQPYFSSFVD